MSCHVTRSPRPSHFIFDTGSDQRLEVVKVWKEATIMLHERHTVNMHVPNYLYIILVTDVKGYPFEGEGI